MARQLTYSAVTPARNEAANLERLADAMASQSLLPRQWVIVDNGSDDESPAVIARIVEQLPFASTIGVPNVAPASVRGRPIVAAFQSGAAALGAPSDVIVKLDADVSFDADYFERLLTAFASNDRLGIASGTCYEQDKDGRWRPTYATRDHVRGATRAYRLECLRLVAPLEERMGWDGIDELKAQVAGWQTASLDDLRFFHHRPLGARERAWSKWVGQGDMAHYMGYRFGYLLARTGYRMLRELTAVGMLWGYLDAAVRGREQYADRDVRNHLRRQQSLAALPRRVREALGRGGQV
jgi:glycosyltransferase involved in cell wall biosynthesis